MPDKKYGVVARPNIAPAGTCVVRIGTGSNWPLAIYRALKEIRKDPRLKGKRIIFPMTIVVTDANGSTEE